MSNAEILEQADLKDIYPDLTIERISNMLKYFDNVDQKSFSKVKSLNDVPESIKLLLGRIFITKTDKTLPAMKARFINYIELSKDFADCQITERDVALGSQNIDIILSSKDGERNRWVIFLDYFDEINVKRFIRQISSYFENNKYKKPDMIVFVSLKIERKTAMKYDTIKITNSNVPVLHYIEYSDSEKQFKDEDIVIINDKRIKGFNFSSLDEILSCANKLIQKGKCEIKIEDTNKRTKSIWKGIINPEEYFKQGGNKK